MSPKCSPEYPFSKPGSGKTFDMIMPYVELCIKNNDPYLLLAPTHVAADNIKGTTIHAGLHIYCNDSSMNESSYKVLSKVKRIIIDEIFMANNELMQCLHKARMMFPDIIWILVGDEKQCLPVIPASNLRQRAWR